VKQSPEQIERKKWIWAATDCPNEEKGIHWCQASLLAEMLPQNGSGDKPEWKPIHVRLKLSHHWK